MVDKALCFDTLLQVLILNELWEPRACKRVTESRWKRLPLAPLCFLQGCDSKGVKGGGAAKDVIREELEG